MNYFVIYDNLINNAKNRLLEGYTETHHILPRCMGGTNELSNLVKLTAREHYVAHLLLAKMYPDNKSIWYAANMMANRNSRSYEWIKKKHALNVSEDRKNTKSSEETKKKISQSVTGEKNPMFGRKHTDEVKEKIKNHNLNRNRELYIQIGNSRRGKLHSDATKEKLKQIISDRWKEDKEGFSNEQRRRASNPKKKKDGYFKPKSEEHAKNISQAAQKRIRYPCPVCSKMLTKANINNHMKVHKDGNNF